MVIKSLNLKKAFSHEAGRKDKICSTLFRSGILLFFVISLIHVSPLEAFFSHDEFEGFLKRYVHNGHVDYKSMFKNQYPLTHYLKLVAKYPQKKLVAEPRNNKIAFYINVYNAITIKRVLENYPPIYKSNVFKVKKTFKTIKNIKGVWGSTKSKVAGKMLTLDDIYNDILREKFREPLINFALALASVGSPKLQSYAFRGVKLKRQLSDCAREFINDKSRNKFCEKCDTTKLSPIFKWYGEDFTRKYGKKPALNKKYGKNLGAVLDFISRYIPKKYFQRLQKKSHNIAFFEFNWKLNE